MDPPQLLVGLDISVCKEGNTWKVEILMVNEHSYWKQIWDAHVIDETCHIAIVSCINAVRLSILKPENR
jgi:hypothetical protein